MARSCQRLPFTWQVVGSLHYGDEAPSGRVNRSTAALPDGGSLAGGFHTYTLEWEANHMRWWVQQDLHMHVCFIHAVCVRVC